ncbi:hypothetical protein NMY22_g12226 [Coprinellus aureogranulatus]|nr:hypothetical protein NMY22_g12226 [Coprinellus aureogranulatus]
MQALYDGAAMAKEYGRMTKECEDEESTRVFRTEDVSWVSVYLKSIPCRETFSALLESIVKVFEPSRLLTFDIHLPLSLLGEWIVGPLQPFAKTRTSILIRDWSGEMPKAFDGPTEFSGPPEELGAYIQGLVG